MNSIFGKLTFAFLSAAIVLSTACSSDDAAVAAAAAGNATLSDDNIEALATAGTEGVKQAANNDNASLFRPANQPPLQRASDLLTQQASRGPLASSDVSSISDSICPVAGNITGFDSIGQNGGTVTFNNCDTGSGVINGTMTITTSTAGSITTYTITSNVTITYLGTTEDLSFSQTCTFDQNAGTQSCTYNSSGTGIDGRTYTVSDIEVSGNATSGYIVSATITDPDNGVITITTTTPVTFNNCTNGQPDAGVIVVSDGTNSMTVTFIDCNSFSINYNGSTTTYNW